MVNVGKYTIHGCYGKHQFHRENVGALARVPGSSLLPGLVPHISYICIHGGSISTVPTFFSFDSSTFHSLVYYN